MAWYIMEDGPRSESIGLLSAHSNAWKKVAALRQGMDPRKNLVEKHTPAFRLLQQLERDDHQFCAEYYLQLTKHTVDAKAGAE